MMGSMLRRGAISDGATLSLDFTTGTLDPLLTFTRSSSGTYLGADGLVKTASTNVARFEYDTSGNPRGLLIEGGSTNLLVHTERLDDPQVSTEQYWITTYTISGSTNGITGPDGVANSATQFAPIAGNGTCIASAAMGTSAQRSFSFWAKRSSGSTNLEYTLDNGTNWVAVTTTSSWQRFTIAATTAAQRVGFRFAVNNVYEVWGCQLETGANSSSYIKNVSAAGGASRAADSLVIQDGAWRNTANIDSTWYVDGALNKMNTAFNSVFDVVGNFGFTERNRVFISATGSQVRFTHYARSASVNPDFEYAINQASPNGYVYGSRFKVAATFDNTAGENRSSWNGATSTGTTAAACTTTPTYFTITVGAGNDWHFRLIKYWPLSLPQTTLNGITTL